MGAGRQGYSVRPPNLVGDGLSRMVVVTVLLQDSCDVIERLNKILAKLSSLALTSGDFSVCSHSEWSCSELVERPLQYFRSDVNLCNSNKPISNAVDLAFVVTNAFFVVVKKIKKNYVFTWKWSVCGRPTNPPV